MLVWVGFKLGTKHPTSDADLESYSNLHVVPSGYQPKGEGDCRYLAQYNQSSSRCVGLISFGLLPTLDRATLIINPRVGEAYQPRLATRLEEGNSYFKTMARGLRCHQLARPWQLNLMLFGFQDVAFLPS